MRQYGVFLGISAVTAFGSACAYTLNLVYQISTTGLGPLQLVLIGTILETVYLVAQLPSGRLADLRGRRPAVLLGVWPSTRRHRKRRARTASGTGATRCCWRWPVRPCSWRSTALRAVAQVARRAAPAGLG